MEERTEVPATAEDEIVPVFGTWRGIYSAVVVCAVIVMMLIAAFSRWSW